MTVQTLRSPGATTAVVNTVANVPTKFYGTMGAPHTFTDPVTGETITIVSEATAVDAAFSVSGSNIIIDAIAPGYTDTRGSLVGDIIVVKPITEWANNIFNILSQSHEDDGKIKNSAITYNANIFDHVQSGAVLAGLGYGANLNVSLSAGVCYINGIKQTIAAVATRGYTASKDTYVDALYNASGTATIVYTEVATNAASPALAANSIRLGIVVTGASNIANVGAINQGQTDKVLPIVSGNPYTTTESLGNLICPRDPNRRILAYRQLITQTNINAAGVSNIPGLGAISFINPDPTRKIKISGYLPLTATAGGLQKTHISDNSLVYQTYQVDMPTVGAIPTQLERVLEFPAGLTTLKGQVSLAGTTNSVYADSPNGWYAWIKVELE